MKKGLLFSLLFLTCHFLHSQVVAPDLIITNGRIIDGTGNSWFRADVAVKGDRIMAVQKGLAAKYPSTKI
ncbi:MAG: hypothetical protein ACK4YD_06300, partial [Chitinophagia bacterium]